MGGRNEQCYLITFLPNCFCYVLDAHNRYRTDILDALTRTYRGLYADSDHFMVGVKFRPILTVQRNRKNEKRTVINTKRLEKQEDRDRYKRILNEELETAKIEELYSVDEKWNLIKEKMEKCVSECDQKRSKSKNKWFDEECERELKERNKLRLLEIRKATEVNKLKYTEQWKACKKLLRYNARTVRGFLKQLIMTRRSNFINYIVIDT
ncbi:unnamed protein product [Acanthoscelides obtectus]|uniref:Uncharacterized protein n=1 Tax=Acanthoscelides obtectus TaxID=200917 RepID=A0A9P0NSK8_ACAOB|nr:unnamed protein product [Acanthoscelides obtectus]CAK1642807.1 hypothetical protein AOBTE_LOCUS13220 [Acanthoscelides obtectus]